MQYTCLLFFLAFALAEMQLTSEDQCLESLYHYANRFMGDRTIISLVMYTGKEANDLGDHKNCVKKNGNYLIVDYKKHAQPTISLGICIPLNCTPEYMKGYRNSLANIMNGMLKHQSFTENEVEVYDPMERNKEGFVIGTGFYVTMCIVLVLVFMQILGECAGKRKADSSCNRILNCFCFTENSCRVFYGQIHPEDMMNGLRVLAMYWIIIGQSLIVTLKAPMYNVEELVQVVRENRLFVFIMTAPWAVDVFLCISGFFSAVTSFNVLKEEGNRSALTFLKLYLYRYLRLLPVYGLGLLVSNFVIPLLNDGPIYSRVAELQNNCGTNAPWNLLMLNNFINTSNLCLDWTWYISLDFQLFLLAPLLTLVFFRTSKIGFIILVSLIGVSLILQVSLVIVHDLNIYQILESARIREDLFKSIIMKPYCHLDTYLIGTVVAWFYLSQTSVNDSLKESSLKRYILYILGIVLVLVVFFTYPELYNSTARPIGLAAICMSLSKLLFVLGLMMLLYPALLKKCRGSILLSIEFWSPLAKATYSAYIFHFALFMFYVMTLEEGVLVSFHKLVRNATDVLVITYLAALLLTLVVDYPMRRLWKLVFNLGKEEPLNSMEEETHTSEQLITREEEE